MSLYYKIILQAYEPILQNYITKYKKSLIIMELFDLKEDFQLTWELSSIDKY